jgi:hypothetical protein
MDSGFLGVSWFVWGLLALVLAGVWTVVWPAKKGRRAVGLQHFLLRWSHALAWALLALSFFVRALGTPEAAGAADLIALAALGVYFGFILALLLNRG